MHSYAESRRWVDPAKATPWDVNAIRTALVSPGCLSNSLNVYSPPSSKGTNFGVTVALPPANFAEELTPLGESDVVASFISAPRRSEDGRVGSDGCRTWSYGWWGGHD